MSVVFTILAYFLIYIIGSFVINFINLNDILKKKEIFFIKILIGLISLTTIFAIINSKGLTILIWLIPIFSFAYFASGNKLKKFKFNSLFLDLKYMIFFISIVLLFSCFFLYILFKTKEIIPNDFLFYGSIADYLNIYGIENYNLNIYDTKGVKLYHYFNEWSSAFFSRIFGLPGSVALVYVYFPLVMSVLFIGIYALVNSLFKLSSLQSLFYTSVFFISSQFWGGTSVAYLIQIKGFSIRFGSLFITANYLKLLIVITFFAAFLILIRRNQRLLSMAFLLAIPFIWPTTLFGVFGGLILYFVYESIKIKELHLKSYCLLE